MGKGSLAALSSLPDESRPADPGVLKVCDLLAKFAFKVQPVSVQQLRFQLDKGVYVLRHGRDGASERCVHECIACNSN